MPAETEQPPAAAPELAELVTALSKAQGEFPTIEKGKTATVTPRDKPGYTYKYADIADVLAAVRPVLSKHELAIVQRTKTNGGGKTILLTELRHSSGQILESEVELSASPGNPQQFGGMLTYLRRYEVVTLLGIAAEEDRDAQDVEPVRPANGNGGGQAPAPLPGWARPASHNRLAELGAALIPIMGATRARRTAATVKAQLGEIPELVVMTAKLVGENVAEAIAAVGPEGTLAELAARLEQEEADLQARLEAERAAQAAETGDTPPPEGYGGGQAAGAEDVEPPAGVELEPAGGGEGIDHQADETPPAPPAPGTVEKPELEEGETERDLRDRLEQAGCTCPDPLAPDKDESHVDTCPIKGHGIPF